MGQCGRRAKGSTCLAIGEMWVVRGKYRARGARSVGTAVGS